MSIAQLLLPELDQETTKTRKTLDRLPDHEWNWKPHDKSPTLGWIGGHIANLPEWGVMTLTHDSIDIAPVNSPGYTPVTPEHRRETLQLFAANIAKFRAALAATTDEQMQKPWTLLRGGKTVFTMTRYAVLRGMVLNHLIHHRAQVSVYLRLLNESVPAIYGPSADEQS